MNHIAAITLTTFTLLWSGCTTAKKAYDIYNQIPREASAGYDQRDGAYIKMTWKFGGTSGKSVVATDK